MRAVTQLDYVSEVECMRCAVRQTTKRMANAYRGGHLGRKRAPAACHRTVSFARDPSDVSTPLCSRAVLECGLSRLLGAVRAAEHGAVRL